MPGAYERVAAWGGCRAATRDDLTSQVTLTLRAALARVHRAMSVVGGVFVTISWYFIPKENQGYAKKLLAWVSFSDILSGAVYVAIGIAGASSRGYLDNPGACVAYCASALQSCPWSGLDPRALAPLQLSC